ncbi:UvrD-helicase domain-containing protein [Candidatus Falkowbacteria bacterium]|nr:UvrD-helicase domain-containing protein [Candidatus Falkowbacteria bacterium]
MAEKKSQYNTEQKKAITFGNGPLLIVAGAGTGKTMVITERIAHLILDKGVNTDAILALTFTEKAAQEMEERVDRLLPYGYVDLWISTFHSFCQKILEQHALDIGIPNNFKLLDETKQWLLVRENFAKFNLDYYKPLGNPTKFIHALIKHFSRAKDEEAYPEHYLAYAEKLKGNADSTMSDELLAEESLRIKEVAEAYHTYQQLLLDNNFLDFGDLINYTIKLFKKRPNILKKYQKQFEYILVDEFQDTNIAQYDLIKMLCGEKKNLTVVGDDDQSIYKFRGASVSNIMQFKKDFPESQEVVLTQNYRSTQNILDLAYNFIQLNNPNRLEYELNKIKKGEKGKKSKKGVGLKKIDKHLIAENKGKGIIEHLHEKTLDDEVQVIIKKIIELKKKDKEATWSDFAILIRSNDAATPFINYLRKTNIPHQFMALRGLYAKPVILDIMSYFKLLDNYHESPAVYRILNSLAVDIEAKDIIQMTHEASRKTESLYEVMQRVSTLRGINAKTISEVNQLLGWISKHTQLAKQKTVGELLKAFLEDTGYLEKLVAKDDYESNQAISYINQFYKRIQAFEESVPGARLNLFMEQMEFELESGEMGPLSVDLEVGPDMVKIITVHSAKGLEFKYVFIPNLIDRRFPTGERSEAIELPDELVKEILPEGDVHLQEERRLFYVAMTRAKYGLFLSSADDYGGARKRKISKFLVELSETNPSFKLAKAALAESGLELTRVKPVVKKEKLEYKLPERFSYSQLTAFGKCPYQYKLGFIIKVPVFGRGTFSYGKSIHETLEEFFKRIFEKLENKQTDLFGSSDKKPRSIKISDLIKFDELKKIFQAKWKDEWYASKDQREKYFKKAGESLKVFYDQIKDNPCQTEAVEKVFNLKVKDFTIIGVIDRIDRLSDGSIVLIDYKTGEAKEEKTISAENKMQLLIYQIAAEQVMKEKVNKLIFYYIDNNSTLEFLGEEKDKERIKQEIIRRIEAIRSSDFAATPSEYTCSWCDFRNICDFRV